MTLLSNQHLAISTSAGNVGWNFSVPSYISVFDRLETTLTPGCRKKKSVNMNGQRCMPAELPHWLHCTVKCTRRGGNVGRSIFCSKICLYLWWSVQKDKFSKWLINFDQNLRKIGKTRTSNLDGKSHNKLIPSDCVVDIQEKIKLYQAAITVAHTPAQSRAMLAHPIRHVLHWPQEIMG